MSEKLLAADVELGGQFPRQSRRLRLGIVGGGRIAGTQAAAARMTGRWDIVAGALSSDPAKAKDRGAEYYLPEDRCYTSFDEMAKSEAARSDGVDAVMITTPNHVHFAAAKSFVEAGINVLCDKPLTNELNEALGLVKLSEAHNPIFGVCYVMSCYPMVRQAREIVRSGAIGKVVQIHAEFMQDWMIPDDVGDADHVKWRLDPKKSGKTSCVGDIGTHAAHLASFISGLEMTHVRAELHVCGAPKPLEDTVFMMTRYAGNIPGTLLATRIASGNRGGLRVRVFGSEGAVEWDMENAEYLKFNRYGEADRVLSRGHGHGMSPAAERFVRTGRGFPEGLIEAWANLYTEFAVAVAARHDAVALPDGWLGFPRVQDGARGVAFVDAVVASHEAGGEWTDCRLAPDT